MFHPQLAGFLTHFPVTDDMVYLSEPRHFAHVESDYDNQYAIDPSNLAVGKGLVNLLRRSGADFHGPALEIGCGTGLLSLGLVAERAYPVTVLSDPSPAFLRITRKKLEQAKLAGAGVRYAVLRAEDTNRLPTDTFALIALRSTLHHVIDVDRFLAESARALRRGGILTFQEPCMEGYVLMGAMAQFLPLAAAVGGSKLTTAQEAQVQNFIETMKFYARRDIDKSQAEDKHLFRPDELQRTAASLGMRVEFWPNRAYEHFAAGDAQPPCDDFENFFFMYLKYCMSWEAGLLEHFRNHFARYCNYIRDLSANENGPHMHGVFICRKL